MLLSTEEMNPFEALVYLKSVEREVEAAMPQAQKDAITYHTASSDKTGKVAIINGAAITIKTVKVPPVATNEIKELRAKADSIESGLKLVNQERIASLQSEFAQKTKDLLEELNSLQSNEDCTRLRQQATSLFDALEGDKTATKIAVTLPK